MPHAIVFDGVMMSHAEHFCRHNFFSEAMSDVIAFAYKQCLGTGQRLLAIESINTAMNSVT